MVLNNLFAEQLISFAIQINLLNRLTTQQSTIMMKSVKIKYFKKININNKYNPHLQKRVKTIQFGA